MDSASVTEDDVADEIDELRTAYAWWEPATRKAGPGDRLLLDIDTRLDGEYVPTGQARRLPYLVGSQLIPTVDPVVVGAMPGARLVAPTEIPAGTAVTIADVHITVHEIQSKALPALDVAFVRRVSSRLGSDLATVEGLRRHLRKAMETRRRAAQTQQALKTLGLDLLAAHPADSATRQQIRRHVTDLSRGPAPDQAGLTDKQRAEDLYRRATLDVRMPWLLDQVATAENLHPNLADLKAAVIENAKQDGLSFRHAVTRLIRTGRLETIAAALLRRRSAQTLLDRAEVVDHAGHCVVLQPLDSP